MARHFSIDSLAIRNGRVFGWGWFLDTEARLVSGELLLTAVDGSAVAVPCLDGAARPDVSAAFPGVAHAASCGFMLMAATAVAIDAARGGRFVARLADGEVHEVALATLPTAAMQARGGLLPRLAARLRSDGLAASVRSGLRLAKLRLGGLLDAWRRHRVLHSRRAVTVVFDHDMGGGANAYRQRLVDTLVAQGRRVVLVTPQLAALECEVRVLDARGVLATWRDADEAGLLATLDRMRVDSIELNNLVGFADSTRILHWCVERRRHGSTLAFHLHDFHAVCPAFTLIDADGRYCGVPELDACRACLPRNAANSLGLGQGVDPAVWRREWAAVLEAADRIIVFSSASAAILERAYPAMRGSKRIEVRPHVIDARHLRRVRPGGGEVVKVAVIGNISRPKGADIVAGIVGRAEALGLALQVVVIGTLQASTPVGPHLVVHGAFDGAELPDLVERYGIDVCLVPSVCPETYSFVTDEIMAMDLPVAVFDIGAPAERVSRYARGEVIARMTAEDALAAIMRLAKKPVAAAADARSLSSG